jgi:hypothetical protein
LTLVYANDVDNFGEVVGGAFDSKTGNSPGFVAIPVEGVMMAVCTIQRADLVRGLSNAI